MYDINWIRQNLSVFDHGLKRRRVLPLGQKLINIDDNRRSVILELEQAQQKRNELSREIGKASRISGVERVVAGLHGNLTLLKAKIQHLEKKKLEIEGELKRALAEIPNLPADEVPDGKDASDNIEHHHFGAKRDYGFVPRQHFDLGEALGDMDFETAAKLSGARFVVLKRGLARLERALGQFMLDLHTSKHGYTEVAPPLLVRDQAMFGTAQLPKFAEDQFPTKIAREKLDPNPIIDPIERFLLETAGLESFKQDYRPNISIALKKFGEQVRLSPKPEMSITFEKPSDEFHLDIEFKKMEVKKMMQIVRNAISHSQKTSEVQFRDYLNELLSEENFETLWLIPTAEVPLTNLVRESILDEAALPMRFTALTPCFRAEAGAAGKDTRGMIRQHQFNKVELVSIATPEQSKDEHEHERMLNCAEEVLQKLELHYRVVTLCAGDMGFAAQKTYDIEVWLPGQGAYREISSCSACGEFQARRMGARFRAKEGRQVRHVHTFNGSGVAVGRALIAVMETYQQQGGSIAVPEVLQPYMGGLKTIEPAG